MRDRTIDEDFIEENADRLLAWDFVHGAWCAGKRIPPWVMSRRTGLSTLEINDVIDSAIKTAKNAIVAEPYDIIDNSGE